MKKLNVILIAMVCLLSALIAVSSASAAQGKITLWGQQVAGSGHMKNAETTGNRAVLNKPATITKVDGNTQDYCIWAAVTPTNRTAKAILCSKDGASLVGKTIPAGTYTLLPSVEKQKVAKVTVSLLENS